MSSSERIQLFSTIRDWIRFAVTEFTKAKLYYGHGTENALDEAIYLILHILHLPFNSPATIYDATLSVEERKLLEDIIQKRITERKPAAYLTHEAFFMGRSFYVDERVLIPRSPIAELIQKQFSPWIESENVSAILDLCTGSGCIAITCAEMFPEAEIIASDISQDALDVAQINIEKYHLQSLIKLIKSDLFENIPPQKFDVIISNPPYVDLEDMNALPQEYHHEPRLALEAGNDGLNIIKKILEEAKDYLSDQGILIVEVGNSAEALVSQFPHLPFTWLEFEKGESEVFLLPASSLRTFAKQM
jgi:ribosomal protein L3 glutamine methyltransferase